MDKQFKDYLEGLDTREELEVELTYAAKDGDEETHDFITTLMNNRGYFKK